MLPWINSGISLLTLIVLTWTLWWLRRYTIAAEEQVEALQKPFLAVTWEKLTDHEISVEMQRGGWEQRTPRLGKVPSDGFAVRKLGTGLALNVSFQLISVLNGKVLKRGYASSFPYLSSTESLQTDIGPSVLYDAINRSALDESENLEFAVEYESVRGVRYQTVISIHRDGVTEDANGQPSGSGDYTWVITGVQMNRLAVVQK